MPLARIDLIAGKPEEYRRTVGDVVYQVDEDVLAPDAETVVELVRHLLVETPLLLERAAACEGELDEDAIGGALDSEEVGIEDEVRRRVLSCPLIGRIGRSETARPPLSRTSNTDFG
jgi:hypothetical protein